MVINGRDNSNVKDELASEMFEDNYDNIHLKGVIENVI